MTASADPKYPIGRFDWNAERTPDSRRHAIAALAELPAELRAVVAGLSEDEIDTPYREGGWTVRQLVHHLADSHMNAYVRSKLALTGENPTVLLADQDRWAALPDSRLPIASSIAILDGLHERWAALWGSLGEAELGRTFMHPERGQLTLDTQLHLYAWHCRHHVAHIAALRARAHA